MTQPDRRSLESVNELIYRNSCDVIPSGGSNETTELSWESFQLPRFRAIYFVIKVSALVAYRSLEGKSIGRFRADKKNTPN